MNKRIKIAITILFFIVTALTNAQSKKNTGYPIKEYLGQTNISSVSLSPNGLFLVVLTMKNNFESNKEEHSLWRFTLDEKGLPIKKIKLVSDTNRKYNFKWDKSGNSLFFVSKNENGRNLFKIDMDGGEAYPLLNEQKIANNLSGYELYGENEILFNSNKCVRKHDNDSLYEDVVYKSNKNSCTSIFYKLNYKKNSLDTVFTIKYPILSFKISPNNKKIVFVSDDEINFYKFNKKNRFHSYLYDINSKKIEKQLTNDGGIEYPEWLNDTKIVFNNYGDPKQKKYNYLQGKLYEFNLNNSTYKPLIHQFKGAVSSFQTFKNNKILFTATNATKLNLYETGKNGVNQLTFFDGKITNFTYSEEKEIYVFAVVTKNSFPEIYVSKGRNKLKSPVKISEFNEKLNNYPKPKVETVSWKNSENETIEGVLIRPSNMSKTDKLPLIVDIHGGPWSARYEALTLDGLQYYYYGSLLASKGFIVLQPNYSGSIGKGNKYLTNILKSPIKKPTDDIIKGVEYLIEKGWVDKDNMIVMGASYGGVLTNSIITETNMFKAALPSCGNWNEIADYGTSDGDILQGYLFNGTQVWDDFETYWKESPMSKVTNIKTPTLITHGGKDVRVPTHHSKAMYWALQELGTAVELVIFPEEGHLYRQPKNKLKKVMIEMNWIDKYINSLSLDFKN